MQKIRFSIKLPFLKIFHFDSWKQVSESRWGCFGWLAHYDHYGRYIGKSIRDFVGDLIHYDSSGKCSGYSRRSGFIKITHYNNRGLIEGKTYCVCGILFFHVETIE